MKKFLFTVMLSFLVLAAFKADVSAEAVRKEGFTKYTYRMEDEVHSDWQEGHVGDVYLKDGTFLYSYQEWTYPKDPKWGTWHAMENVSAAALNTPEFKAEFDYAYARRNIYTWKFSIGVEVTDSKAVIPKYYFNKIRTVESNLNDLYIHVNNGMEEYSWNIHPKWLAQDIKNDFSPYVTYETNPATLQNYYPEGTNYYLFHTAFNPEEFKTKDSEWDNICHFTVKKLLVDGKSVGVGELWKGFYKKYCTKELLNNDGEYSYCHYFDKYGKLPEEKDLGCLYMSSFERKTGNLRGAFRTCVWRYSYDPNACNEAEFYMWSYFASSDFVFSDASMIGCKPENVVTVRPGEGGYYMAYIDLSYFYGLDAIEDYLKKDTSIDTKEAASKDFVDSSSDLGKDLSVETDEATYTIDDKDIDKKIPFEPTVNKHNPDNTEKKLIASNGYGIDEVETLEFKNKYDNSGKIPGETTITLKVDTNKFPVGSNVDIQYYNEISKSFEWINSVKVQRGGIIKYTVPHFSKYVIGPEVKVTGVSLNQKSLTMVVGDTNTLKATIQPVEASNRKITWTSSNPKVATVSSTGVIKAFSAGTTVISASAPNGVKAECTVTVSNSLVYNDNTSKIGLSGHKAVIAEGKNAVVTLPKGTKATVKSKNNKVATVKYNNKTGKISITAKEAGSTKISVKVGKKTEYINVTVNGVPLHVNPDSVTVPAGKNATVSTLKNKNIKVSSSNKSVASASYSKGNGKITIQGKKKGSAVITVKYGKQSLKVNVNVESTTTKLKVKSKVTLDKKGKSETVKIEATPKRKVTGETAKITNSDPTVVKAEYKKSKDSIKLTALKKGKAKITVKVGRIQKSINVTVKAN
ncbi:MAG: Ig-like domain-containing protein [Lachnospiraceae bacterium]|nr:Ig-like domain-containing protein [Lachnospiraceae bacterium]